MVNLSNNAISKYENGRAEPSIEDLIKLADYFDVTIDYLVGRTKAKSSWTTLNFNIDTGNESVTAVEIIDDIMLLSPDNRAYAIETIRLLKIKQTLNQQEFLEDK